MKKIINTLLYSICFVSFTHSAEEQPAKKQKTTHETLQSDMLTFEAVDGSLNTAPLNIAELSPYIANFVDEKQTSISFAKFGINSTTLAYYLDCLKNIKNGIESQKKFKDFPAPFLLQRTDGAIIAKNALPAVSRTIAGISEEDFINLVKLAQFTEVDFLLNALCAMYISKHYAAKNFSDFLSDKDKLLQIFGEEPFKLLKKHAYINKVLPWPDNVEPYEMSIGDYITLYPQNKNKVLLHRGFRLHIIDKLNNAENTITKHITSLDGLDLINLEPIKSIKIQSDFLVPMQYDPFFPESPFDDAGKVARLEISNTILYNLPENFLEGLTSLEELTLINTMLSGLSPNFFEPVATTIQDVQLINNKITALDKNIFYKPSQFFLFFIFLADNPICEKLDESEFNLNPMDNDPNHRYIDCITKTPLT